MDSTHLVSRRKEAERNRNVIANFTEDYAQELKKKDAKRGIGIIENCFKD